MGKGEFEKSWKEAFEGVDLTPSSQLWTGIEASIANHEVERYRRGIAYYKWAAAAGILLFAGLLGYLGYQSLYSEQSVAIDANKLRNEEVNQDIKEEIFSDKRTSIAENQEGQEIDEIFSSPESSKSNSGNELVNLAPFSADLAHSSDLPVGEGVSNNSINNYNEGLMQSANRFAITTLDPKGVSHTKDQDLSLLSTTVKGVPILKSARESKKMILWAGLTMAPGYFDPNYQSLELAQVLGSSTFSQTKIHPEEQHRSGQSLSLGLEIGMKLSNKWILSTGVQYLNNNVQSSTNAILNERTPVFSTTASAYDLQESTADISYVPTELDNTFQFLSIPIQAGYLVIDKKVKLIVNGGVASDIFLKNKISAVDHSLETITINPGSNAPFKSVYFNGLVGAQVNYEFLPRYTISLEPTYKIALSDFARPGSNYSSLPSSLGVGVGVKYIFK